MAIEDGAVLKSLRERLNLRDQQLTQELGELRAEQAQELGESAAGEVEDLEERGEHRTRQAVRSVEQQRDVQELREIEAARHRMSEGRYGACVDCGGDIPLARLQVQPAAARCVPCQAVFERSVPAVPSVSLPGSSADTGRRS